jgi:hypothetical protein
MYNKTPTQTNSAKDPILPPALSVPEGENWSSTLRDISTVDADTLVSIVRTLYPHDSLPERVYRRVVMNLDREGAGQNIREICRHVDTVWPIPFAELAESYRVNILRSIEVRPGFVFVQRMALRYLYDDLEVWEAFGYQGASFHLGGYIKRGFNDLDWLPPLPNDI